MYEEITMEIEGKKKRGGMAYLESDRTSEGWPSWREKRDRKRERECVCERERER